MTALYGFEVEPDLLSEFHCTALHSSRFELVSAHP